MAEEQVYESKLEVRLDLAKVYSMMREEPQYFDQSLSIAAHYHRVIGFGEPLDFGGESPEPLAL